MAYDFLSAMHQRQWEALRAFTDSTLATLNPKNPNKADALVYRIIQADRMLAQYQAAYRHVGGLFSPYYDRSKFKSGQKPTEYADYGMVLDAKGYPTTVPNTEIPQHGTPSFGGIETSPLVHAIKKFQLPEIKWKKERLEFRIKRIHDLIDRLSKELALVSTVWPEGAKKAVSLEEIGQLETQFSDPSFNGYNLHTGDTEPFNSRGAGNDVTLSLSDFQGGAPTA